MIEARPIASDNKYSLEAIKELSRRNVVVRIKAYTLSGKILEGGVHIPKDVRLSDILKKGENNRVILVDGSLDGVPINHTMVVVIDNCEFIVLIDDYIKIENRTKRVPTP